MFKKVLLIIFLVLCTCNTCLYAYEQAFCVYDTKSGVTNEFSSLSEAQSYYDKHLDEYDNSVISDGEKIIDMEYGIVLFDDEIFKYHSTITGKDDYLCGRYGIDGAYLYSKGDDVYFKVGSEIGYTASKNVILIPIEEAKYRLSKYYTKDNCLYHNIKTQFEIEYYSSSLCLGIKPDYLKDDSEYYSYDGHYFYEDFYLMIDDYKKGKYENAINEEPYYNYYQYLSSRSLSNYTSDDINKYITNTLGINKNLNCYYDTNLDGANDIVNRSALYGNIDAFFAYQNIYGVNALISLSSAINDSSYGKSLDAYTKNNLFVNNAYDVNEIKDYRYDTVEKSILAFDKYLISNKYSNTNIATYAGSNIGDKIGGYQNTYSLDHYYGEKLASVYHKIDSTLGYKDLNTNCLGISTKDLDVYNDSDLNDYHFTITNNGELSYVILEELDNSYKIQLDNSFNSDYLYDFNKSVGYVNKNSFKYLLNKDAMHNDEFVSVSYDFDGGEYADSNQLKINIKKGTKAINIKPYKEGYEFIGYDHVLDILNVDTTYKAEYKKIESINLDSPLKDEISTYDYLDLTNTYINVTYEDGTSKKIEVNSDMVNTLLNLDDEVISLLVNYNGVTYCRDLKVNKEYLSLYNDVNKAINDNDYKFVKGNIAKLKNYPLSMSQIRMINDSLRKENERNYVILDNTNKYDISLSGLDLGLADKNSFIYVANTYYVLINDIDVRNKEIIENVSKGYGFNTVTGLNIAFKFNYENIDLNANSIVQINIDNKRNDLIYSVYHVNKNGDVVKCRTTQSNNYIQFEIAEGGDYLVLAMDSFNTYNIEDHDEALSYKNMGIDNHRLNLEFLFIIFLVIVSFVGITIYYIGNNKKEKEWIGYKKSLLKADTVQEEKQKN